VVLTAQLTGNDDDQVVHIEIQLDIYCSIDTDQVKAGLAAGSCNFSQYGNGTSREE
jgi:hypothetical protein